MPRPRSKSAKRWYSAKYANGYCFERHGRVWVRVADYMESTGLHWSEANKREALVYLDAFLEKFFSGVLQGDVDAVPVPRTVYALAKEYKDTRLGQSGAIVLEKFKNSLRFHFPKDVPFSAAEILSALREAQTRELAQSTRKRYMTTMKAMFTYAVECEYIKKNPVATIGIPKEPKKIEHLVLKPDEIKRLIGFFENIEDRYHDEHALIFEWLWRTGMRVGEVIKMKWSDYEEERGILKIIGKGSIYREFPVSLFPEAVAILEKMRKHTFPDGKVWRWKNTQNIQVNFRKAALALNFNPKYVVHTLRGSAGWYYENVLGLDFTLVAELLGHSPSMNIQRYRKKRTGEDLKDALKKATDER
jgi:integrase/recombinase XerD